MRLFAYIDPGMGLLLWQSVIAACLGTLFYLKKTRAWIANVLRKLFRVGKPPDKVDDTASIIPK
jgi:hypothetical protein